VKITNNKDLELATARFEKIVNSIMLDKGTYTINELDKLLAEVASIEEQITKFKSSKVKATVRMSGVVRGE